MVNYAKMSDAEIKEYREKSRKDAEQRQKEWEKKHPNGVHPSCKTSFDVQHHTPYYNYKLN